MPGINIIDGDGDVQRFPDAEAFHVDDRGQLHLTASNKRQVASFAKDCWRGVSTEDQVDEPVKRATLDDLLRELQAIRRVMGDPIVVQTRPGDAWGNGINVPAGA